MPKVVVVYHSGYGHTQRMAQSVAKGADAELLDALKERFSLKEGAFLENTFAGHAIRERRAIVSNDSQSDAKQVAAHYLE